VKFSSLALDRKLLLSMLLTSLVALLLAGIAFIAYEVYSYRRAAVQQLTALAGVTAQNVAGALAFDDPLDAGETLAALSAERQVRAAILYDSEGRRFAAYSSGRLPATPGAGPAPDGHRFSGNTLEYTMPVQVGDARLGTLELDMDTSAFARTLGFFTVVGLGIFLVAMLAGLAIARRLQRQVSEPIIALSRTASAVSERHDYTVRAERADQPEIRVLTDAFNQMLRRIEETQAHLQAQLVRLDLLQRTTRAIGERQDLPSILQVIVGRLETELPVDFACIARCDAGTDALVIESLGPRAAALAQRGGVHLNERIDLKAGERDLCFGGIVYEPEVGESAHPLARRLARGGLAAVVIAPLVTPDASWGVLVAGRTSPHSFSSPDTEFLQQLSDHASLAVRQARLTDDLKRAYDDLRQSQLTFAQQERLRALGQMASGIAHDINNAISPVTLYVHSLLDREPALSERGRRQLETIERAVEDVTQTVQRMREFYRRREAPASFTSVELNSLCREVIELTRPRWDLDPQERGAQIELREEFSAQPVWVRGVDVEIRDALVNLVFNAVDAMPVSGVLSIHTSPRTSREDLACVAVADTGVGMDEATRARCLEPFFTTKGERGTGMGLAMVYGMVQRHGGEIEVESATGAGTTVRLLLPRSSPEGRLTPAPTVPAMARPLRLLVIDDDPLLIQSLRDTLELEGHSVTVADGGQSGVDAFVAATSAGKRHDVVITDLGMPHLDGRAVAAAVKAVDPGTPVILLTGWGARLATENETPVGVDRVLGKPPRLTELRAVLAELARNHAPG
jgi:signal transduction histidine kinase/ActR/RegA family two-component response regulator